MTSQTFFFIFIPILAIILLAVNLIFAPHNPYEEKDSAFECGFHSFLGQNRSEFSISFFIFALLFLLFDLEILLVYPYIVSSYVNEIFGLIIMLIFFLVLTLGFFFELGKNALSIESRQTSSTTYTPKKVSNMKKSRQTSSTTSKKGSDIEKSRNHTVRVKRDSLDPISNPNVELPKHIVGKGNYQHLKNGRKILDASGGAAVNSLGYGNERLLRAMYEYLKKSGTNYAAFAFFTSEKKELLKQTTWYN